VKLLLTGSTGFLASALQKKLNDHIVILTSRGDEIESSPRFFRKNISSTEDFSDCLSNIDIVDLYFALLPEFAHKETGKYLDQRM
jgi:NAD dependent epimerase/dehydratase family enzyme